MLPTLVATDWKGAHRSKGMRQLCGEAGAKSVNLRDMLPILEGGSAINPTWGEWFMGWPPGWTDLDAKVNRRAWAARNHDGTWWSDDEEERWLPRTIASQRSVPHARARIEAVGNAQVPRCAAIAFSLLQEATK
jgi:hypothetical protein